MSARWKHAVAAAALAVASVGDAFAGDAVTQCGSAQLKILAKLYKGLYAEGTRACAAGSAGNPLTVDAAKLTALVAATSAAMLGAVDKYGDANCFQGETADPSPFIALAQGVADTLCMAP